VVEHYGISDSSVVEHWACNSFDFGSVGQFLHHFWYLSCIGDTSQSHSHSLTIISFSGFSSTSSSSRSTVASFTNGGSSGGSVLGDAGRRIDLFNRGEDDGDTAVVFPDAIGRRIRFGERGAPKEETPE